MNAVMPFAAKWRDIQIVTLNEVRKRKYDITYMQNIKRKMGGGIRMGNTCKPIAVSFQCMTKFTTKKKKLCLC